MKIAQVLASYSMAEADELRKAVGKKKPEMLAKHSARFIEGSVKNSVDKKTAEKLFMLMEKFGGYGFNKSHSAAYAMIAYQTAYLKAHFPVQFMAALLTQDMGNQDKTIKNIAECREMGIPILPPDINQSRADFSVVEGNIRFGLAAVKNVGLMAVESIIEERERGGPFRDLMDFCTRVEGAKVNRRVMEGLIQCGAFDSMGVYRSRLMGALDDVLRISGANHDPNQMNMFGSPGSGTGGMGALVEFPDMEEWDEKEKLRKEKEALGFYITGHPLDRYARDLGNFVTCSIQDLANRTDKSTVKVAGVVEDCKIKRTKRGDKMAILGFEDLTGSTEVVVFPDVFSNCSHLLKTDEPLLITGSAEVGESSAKIIAHTITAMDSVRQTMVKAIELPLSEDRISRDMLEDLKYLAFKHSGDCKLLFSVDLAGGEKVVISASDRFNVRPCRELITEIETLIGSRIHEIGAFSGPN
jgi:DNA polymerase-3 subunit alpha